MLLPIALSAGCLGEGVPRASSDPAVPALGGAVPDEAVPGGAGEPAAARIIDGDTLEQAGVRHRLFGIDAPESRQRCTARGGGTWSCGEAASVRLERLVAGGRLSCEEVPGQRDRYGRRISRCAVGGADVAAALVADGLAWAYRRYSSDYVALEEEARARGRGVWQARTDAPWHVRRGTGRGEARGEGTATGRNDVDAPAPPGCPIKGNLSAGGRIYHVPGSRSYARTVIRTERGERWFCSELEARTAGWRRAR